MAKLGKCFLKRISNIIVILFILNLFSTNTSFINKAYATGTVFSNHITRSGDKLKDGTNDFRFISFNAPELLGDVWGKWDAWEQEDTIKSISQAGGTVVRTYVVTVGTSSRHVSSAGVFNEELFKGFDKMLELCNQYGIRVIIPFVDAYSYRGGIAEYAAFRGKTPIEFYTDANVKSDFKQTINYILNRTNTYTGIQYKNDKAILAWETGNELQSPTAWASEIAEYIKSIDTNHLVLDGKFGIDSNSLTNSNIDIVSNHYYHNVGITDYAAQCDVDRDTTLNKRPLIIGEFGIATTSEMTDLLETVIDNGTSGALLWSLRSHKKDGGFYHHQEMPYNGVTYWSYHWPGFPYGDSYDETGVLSLMRQKAFAIRGLSLPTLEVPSAPVLFPIASFSSIKWRGSTGASSYLIERGTDVTGPWTVLNDMVYDSISESSPLFSDSTANIEQDYYYRIKARNSANVMSDYSNIEKYDHTVIPTNVVQNVGFEAGFSSWGTTDSTKWAVSSADKHLGTYSVKLNGNGGWSNLSQLDISVESYKDYVFSFYAKCGGKILYRVRKNTDGTTIVENHTTVNNQWTKYSLVFNSGSNTKVKLYLGDETTGVSYLDDFEIRCTTLSQAGNIIQNPSLETGSFTPWGISDTSKWIISSQDKYNGTYAVRLDGNGTWSQLNQINISVALNTNYVFSFYAKCGAKMLYMVRNNSTGTAIVQGHTTANNMWTKYSINFNSGSTDKIKLYIGDEATGVSYLDDFSIKLLP